MKSKLKYLAFFCFVFVGFVFVSCSDREQVEGESEIESIYQYIPPIDLGDGIETSTLQDENLEEVPIRWMMDSINAGVYDDFHSLLIFRNGKLILEEYFNGWNQTDLHPMWSVTKSITSALVGIAIEQQKISSVEEKIHTLLSSFTHVNWTQEHKQITLEHCLTMSSGYKWNDRDNGVSGDDSENSYIEMINSEDWIKYVLELPLDKTPGTDYKYNNGTASILSVILSEAIGEDLEQFADHHLFSNLNIDNYYWGYLPGNYPGTAGNDGGVYLTPRDMSKFGLLYLNEGQRTDLQLVNKTWVDSSTSSHTEIVNNENLYFTYGYLWWRNERLALTNGSEIQVPYAVGHGGQYIFLIKDFDMIVVITSPYENQNRTTLDVFDMISTYIIGAIID